MSERDTTQKQGTCLHPSPQTSLLGFRAMPSLSPKSLELCGGRMNKVEQGRETYVQTPAVSLKGRMTLGKSFTCLSIRRHSLIAKARQEAEDHLNAVSGGSTK